MEKGVERKENDGRKIGGKWKRFGGGRIIKGRRIKGEGTEWEKKIGWR